MPPGRPTVPDKAEIAKYVDEAYPVQKTAPPEWKIGDIDTKTNKTRWKNTKTGADVWKSSVKGDTIPGPQITKGKTKIPATAVNCP